MLCLDAGCMRCAQLQSVIDPLMLRTIRFDNSHESGNKAIVVFVTSFIAMLDHMRLLHRWPPRFDLSGNGKELHSSLYLAVFLRPRRLAARLNHIRASRFLIGYAAWRHGLCVVEAHIRGINRLR
jgi:hypothetical protein